MVDVYWFVVRFSVGPVGVVGKVKSNVQVVCTLLVCKCSDVKSKIIESMVRSCLTLSPSLPDLVFGTARPSSRYRPTFLPSWVCREFKINSPTSSHISAPS